MYQLSIQISHLKANTLAQNNTSIEMILHTVQNDVTNNQAAVRMQDITKYILGESS